MTAIAEKPLIELTPLELADRILEYCSTATPGDWSTWSSKTGPSVIARSTGEVIATFPATQAALGNAAFVAQARELLPVAAAVIQATAALCKEAQRILDEAARATSKPTEAP